MIPAVLTALAVSTVIAALIYNTNHDVLCEQTPVPRDSSALKTPPAGHGAAPMYVSPSTIQSFHSSPNPYRECLSPPVLQHIA
jgi:hypothetical protein